VFGHLLLESTPTFLDRHHLIDEAVGLERWPNNPVHIGIGTAESEDPSRNAVDSGVET
jgi:hypothetical protein